MTTPDDRPTAEAPRYAFRCCTYPAMSDESRDMLHQLVNAVGDRFMKPTTGRIVQYKLSANDATAIARRRVAKPHEPGWPLGAQAHVGNHPSAGDTVPLIVVHVWPDEYGPGTPGVNGQAFLNGNDQLWVTSAKEGSEPGQWSWPERVNG